METGRSQDINKYMIAFRKWKHACKILMIGIQVTKKLVNEVILMSVSNDIRVIGVIRTNLQQKLTAGMQSYNSGLGTDV